MRLEEERLHLLERVSSFQATQSEHERTVRRDQEEQKTIIVRHIRTSRVVLTALQKELESEKVLILLSYTPDLTGTA